MSNHFNIVSSFQQKFSSIAGGLKNLDSGERGTLIIQMAVKSADLGHCYARMQQHLYWCKCLEDEFFKQGDAEREAGVHVSALMDKNLPGAIVN